MKNYKLIVQYDGTRYSGWQSQGNTQNTIQAKLQTILEKMTGVPIEVQGSGRTDAGVHAKGQVANFHAKTTLSTKDIYHYINRYLPEDIAVLRVEEVPERFHSRLNAKSKTYCYRIWNEEYANVFERKFVYSIPEHLNLDAMSQAADFCVGEHDFQSFCSTAKMKKSTIRTIESIQIERVFGEVRLTVKGSGFLYNMVRILTGTLVEVGLGKRKPEEIMEIIEAKDRQMAGRMMPPQGLTLMSVEY